MTRVAVTGASGFVGSSVVRALERAGVDVVRVVRTAGRDDAIACDLADRSSVETLARAFEGVDAIVHAAAHVHRPIEDDVEVARFRATNVVGTERVVAAARSAGVRRIVYVSTIGVYGFAGGRPTEDEVPDPRTTYATTKLLGETTVVAGSSDPRIVRLATVFGRGDRANYARLVDAVRRGRFVVPGDGSAEKSVIAIDDAGELLARIATTETPLPLLHLADPRPLSVATACDAIASAFGVRKPLRVPTSLLAIPARVGDALRFVGARPPFDGATLEKLTTSTVVDTTRLTTNFPDHRFVRFAEIVRSAYPSEPTK